MAVSLRCLSERKRIQRVQISVTDVTSIGISKVHVCVHVGLFVYSIILFYEVCLGVCMHAYSHVHQPFLVLWLLNVFVFSALLDP